MYRRLCMFTIAAVLVFVLSGCGDAAMGSQGSTLDETVGQDAESVGSPAGKGRKQGAQGAASQDGFHRGESQDTQSRGGSTQDTASQGGTFQDASQDQENASQGETFQGASQENASKGGASQGTTEEFDINTLLLEVEKQAAELSPNIANAFFLEEKENAAKALYDIWDNALNDIWDRLQNTLDEEEKARLLAEERSWIQRKEAEAKAAAAPYAYDDTGYATGYATVFTYQKEAVLTRERVYELAEYLAEKTGQTVALREEYPYAGLYVDTQGTGSVICSELSLAYLGNGSYQVEIGLYRLTTLEGTARDDGEKLLFEDKDAYIKGEITLQEEGAVFTVTESEFTYLKPGDRSEFFERVY